MDREDTQLEIIDAAGTLEIARAQLDRLLTWGTLTDDERQRITDAANESGRAWHRVSGKPLTMTLADGSEVPVV